MNDTTKGAELETVAFFIPKEEQFCLPSNDGSRPFAKAWEALCSFATAQAIIATKDARISELEAAMAAAEMDARRYRWLRDDRDSDWAICEYDQIAGSYFMDGRAPHIVDAAIDTAIAAQEGKDHD